MAFASTTFSRAKFYLTLQHYLKAVVLVFFVALFSIAIRYHSELLALGTSPLSGVTESQQGDNSNATASTSFARSAPIRLVIPSIRLDTTFVPPLSLNSDKTVSVPDNYTQVGWYKGGATPGEVGSAVILGHVDSVSGPAVFYSLGQVKVGDKVMVTRADRTTATFEVTELHRYPQSEFPTNAVYGPTTYPALRLVTCTGIFDHGKQKYSHNLVVYAKLIE